MKRNVSGSFDDAVVNQKRSRSALAFYGKGLANLKQLCSSEAWHAAKRLVSGQQIVELGAVLEEPGHHAVWVQGHVNALNANAAAFPHQLLSSSAAGTSAPAAPPNQRISVQLCLHGSTGELLDADSSCCPGGFQCVLGSFCPCVAALLLCAAKQAALPAEGVAQPLPGLAPWPGSSLADVLTAQQQQLHDLLCLVPHPSCYTNGLGLEAWQYEDRVRAGAKVHFASSRVGGGMYYGGSRPSFDPDRLATLDDAVEDLSSDSFWSNTSISSLQVPPGLLEIPISNIISDNSSSGAAGGGGAAPANAPLDAEVRRLMASRGIPVPAAPPTSTAAATAAPGGSAAGGDSRAAAGSGGRDDDGGMMRRRQRQQALLAAAVREWLAVYGGQRLSGYASRPKVINLAMELLVGGASGAPGRPVAALVLLLRGLWEYLHVHGLGRLLSKPLKALHALRNILLVSAAPLWVRRAVAAQLDAWERGLLWQHAATPLEVSGSVGLVHLLRALQEVRQLCLHHWDHQQLAAMLLAGQQQHQQGTGAAAAAAASSRGYSHTSAGPSQQQHHNLQQDGSGTSAVQPDGGHSSNKSGGADKAPTWNIELPSLLQLRLMVLTVVDASDAYLELAMAGGAWHEAIKRLLRSKERSQLMKAVTLLPRHISSLPERLGYLTQLLGLESLGAPERLEVAARLLLDMRGELRAQVKEVGLVSPAYSRYYGGAGSTVYNGHLWSVTLYNMPDATGPPAATHSHGVPSNTPLFSEWCKFMKLLISTAAEALFEAGRSSQKAFEEHIRAEEGEEGNQQQQDDVIVGGQKYGPSSTDKQQAAAGPSSAAAAAASGACGSGEPEVPRAHMEYQAMLERAHQMVQQIAAHAVGAPVLRYCPTCHEHHEVAGVVQAPPVSTAPKPGDPSWCLLDVDRDLFAGDSGPGSATGYPAEAVSGALKTRGKTGYIEEARIIAAYKQVVPVRYPALLPLCSLDATCLSALSGAVMAHFDDGGVLDTSLSLEPLRDLLGHHIVEMGPGPVRVQAALEVAVYVSIMTPLIVSGDQLGAFYRSLTYQLLGAGQRHLALLAARTRFKLCPGVRAAGELMEVTIAAGPEAEAAAVDLILCKGLVRQLDQQDEDFLRAQEHVPGVQGGAARPRRPPRRAGQIFAQHERAARRLRRAVMNHMLGEGYLAYHMLGVISDSDDELPDDYYAGGEGDEYNEFEDDAYYHPDDPDRSGDERGSADGTDRDAGSDEESGDGDGSEGGGAGDGGAAAGITVGEQGQPIEILDESNSEEPSPSPPAAAAGVAGTGAARPAIERPGTQQQQQQQDSDAVMEDAADSAAEEDDQDSLDTRQLLGNEAAAAIQLKDTATSSRPQVSAAPAIGAGAGGGGGAAGGAGGAGAAVADRVVDAAAAARIQAVRQMRAEMRAEMRALHGGGMYGDDDDSEEMSDEDADLLLMMGEEQAVMRYGQRPVRDLPPAQFEPRPKHTAAGTSSKAKPPSAPGGSGGGGGGGDDGDGGSGGAAAGGGGRQRKRSSAGGRQRRSASAECNPEQAALVSDLFGISSATSANPMRTLRVHLRRIEGLQLWAVVRYAAGRGASADSIRRLGLAAWLSDSSNSMTNGFNSSQQMPRGSDMLRWVPAAGSRDGWMDAARRARESRGQALPQHSYEPYEGVSLSSCCWSGLPSANWASFTAQERLPASYMGGQQHHASPDAQLAWLLAVLGDNSSSNDGSSSSGDGAAAAAPAAKAAPPSARMLDSQFAASHEFTGPRPGFVFKLGVFGLGYYKDAAADTAGPSGTASAAAAAASADQQKHEVDLASVSEVLEQLAVLSKGTRYGLPLLQLCHALLLAGCRSSCMALLPQALLPAATNLTGLTPNTCLVAALQELLPAVAKHGDVGLRVCAAVTSLLITRRPLPANMIDEPEVLAGVLSWWVGLLDALATKPADWTIEKLTGLPVAVAQMKSAYIGADNNNWLALQRLLVKGVLLSLGAQLPSSGLPGALPGEPVKDLEGAPLQPQQGCQLLSTCDVLTKAHWALRIYFSRLCRCLQLCPTLSSLGQLLCPALAAAVQQHTAGLAPSDRQPLSDMAAWKAHRGARFITTVGASRARDWIGATVEWLTKELSCSCSNDTAAAPQAAALGALSSSSGGSSNNKIGAAELLEFVDTLCAALLGWNGPELLPLAVAIRQQLTTQQGPAQHSAAASQPPQQQQQQQLPSSLLSLLQAGLLPAVGRAEELSSNGCVSRGAYKSALQTLMRDEPLLLSVPQDVLRHLALTYWYQEATPAALLTANQLLIRLEGASHAQSLTLPQGTSLAAAAADPQALNAAAAASSLGSVLSGAAAAAANPAAAAAAAGGLAASLPQVHSLLLEHLDLVPSRGGIEAAGLRFLQLQVHAGNGQPEAAMECVFSNTPSNTSATGGIAVPAAASVADADRLSAQMEVADAVLRLVADNVSTPCIGTLMSCAAYRALLQLELPGTCRDGAGDSVLMGLTNSMKVHVLRLTMWRLARVVISRPPGVGQRISSGPRFLDAQPWAHQQYNASHPPPQPSYLDNEVVIRFSNLPPNSLATFCIDQGCPVPSRTHTQMDAARGLCSTLQAQEESLLWCVVRYARLVSDVQLEKDLLSLLSDDHRAMLGQLPVFAMGLGQLLKSNRQLMWAYCTFRNLNVPPKISRYIQRTAHDQASLQRYLAKSTIGELQSFKGQCLPWWDWEMGQKATQAAELAEWLWWSSITWPRNRSALGAGPARQLPTVMLHVFPS